MKHILLVEDIVAENIRAQAEATRRGYSFDTVTTLQEAYEKIDSADAVVSDLFFPPGHDPKVHIETYLPLYQAFRNQRFPAIKDDIVLRAVSQCAELFGMSPADYVNTIMPKMNSPTPVMQAAKDAIAGVQDSDRYEKYLLLEKKVQSGELLPLGIDLTKKAGELKKPSVIVTSTYHHDDAFEAVAKLMSVPYIDTLVDGQKDWKTGFDLLEKRSY